MLNVTKVLFIFAILLSAFSSREAKAEFMPNQMPNQMQNPMMGNASSFPVMQGPSMGGGVVVVRQQTYSSFYGSNYGMTGSCGSHGCAQPSYGGYGMYGGTGYAQAYPYPSGCSRCSSGCGGRCHRAGHCMRRCSGRSGWAMGLVIGGFALNLAFF